MVDVFILELVQLRQVQQTRNVATDKTKVIHFPPVPPSAPDCFRFYKYWHLVVGHAADLWQKRAGNELDKSFPRLVGLARAVGNKCGACCSCRLRRNPSTAALPQVQLKHRDHKQPHKLHHRVRCFTCHEICLVRSASDFAMKGTDVSRCSR